MSVGLSSVRFRLSPEGCKKPPRLELKLLGGETALASSFTITPTPSMVVKPALKVVYRLVNQEEEEDLGREVMGDGCCDKGHHRHSHEHRGDEASTMDVTLPLDEYQAVSGPCIHHGENR